MVVFEELYQDNVLVAIHVDIEDKGQTVKFKEVKPEQPKPNQPKPDQPHPDKSIPTPEQQKSRKDIKIRNITSYRWRFIHVHLNGRWPFIISS